MLEEGGHKVNRGVKYITEDLVVETGDVAGELMDDSQLVCALWRCQPCLHV